MSWKILLRLFAGRAKEADPLRKTDASKKLDKKADAVLSFKMASKTEERTAAHAAVALGRQNRACRPVYGGAAYGALKTAAPES